MTDKDTKDDTDSGKKLTLSGKGKGTLSLKGGAGSGGSRSGTTRGRSRASVAVEVRKKRGAAAEPKKPASKTAGAVLDHDPNLTDAEREARVRALQQAQQAPAQDKDTTPYQGRLVVKKKEEPEDETPDAKSDAPARSKADIAREEELAMLKKINAAEAAQRQQRDADSAVKRANTGPAPSNSPRKTDRFTEERPAPPPRRPGANAGRNRRGGRLTVNQVINNDMGEREARTPSLAAQRRARAKHKAKMSAPVEHIKQYREVIVPEVISVQELAGRMTERTGEVVKKLMEMGVMATANQTIDQDTAELIVTEFGHTVKRVSESDVEIGLGGIEDKPEDMRDRPPVITIMGHVDHGKTSLLDAIRKTDVVAGEAGGITQHIGAYQIQTKDNKKLTFIDTPGHAAFTEMRARGADVTDIVILVVAANDSVMPQTVEAISHAKAAEKPIIVAINKCDLPAADPARVRTELLQHEVITEDMGGDVQCIEVSAIKGTGLEALEEAILLQAEVLELKANPSRSAHGAVIESRQETGKGTVATVLIQKGTLGQSDIFVTGTQWGRVRAMMNDRGKKMKKAIPGQPVEILGLNGTPEAGDDFVVVDNEGRAREISEYRQRKKRALMQAKTKRAGIDQMIQDFQSGQAKELAVIIKGDVHGSVEAIGASLEKLTEENNEVRVKVLHAGVGAITESDITLAGASNALIVGFNVRATTQARDMSKRDGVEIRYYSIIYEVIDEVKALLGGLLSPDVKENFIGYAEIRQVFSVPKAGKVAGCMVTEGMVKRGAKVRLLRDNIVIHEGTLKTLRRFKDEVKEVQKGYECGMALDSYDDIKEGDMIEAFEMVETARTLEQSTG